ncbi:aldehyde dehydrogenase family protein, partial [Enterobacter hormaechei]|nr:aldehyde dehydrogenase family protein [Enterobacter hormaechei]
PLLGGEYSHSGELPVAKPVNNPAKPSDIVGYVRETTEEEVSHALNIATDAGAIWFATPPSERAAILVRAAELMENNLQSLLGILVREAGKTFNNAIAEVREAVDFLYY